MLVKSPPLVRQKGGMDKTSGREADLCRSMRILALSYIDCRVSYHKTLCLQGHHIGVLSFFLNVIVILL